MTYSLNTLNASSAGKSGPRSPGARFGHEITLMAGFVVLVVWMLALWSYAPQDPAWSPSGAAARAAVHNRIGLAGAWLADVSYFAFGFSVWWCLAAGVRAWISSLARLLRGGAPKARLRGVRPLGALFFGVAWPC